MQRVAYCTFFKSRIPASSSSCSALLRAVKRACSRLARAWACAGRDEVSAPTLHVSVSIFSSPSKTWLHHSQPGKTSAGACFDKTTTSKSLPPVCSRGDTNHVHSLGTTEPPEIGITSTSVLQCSIRRLLDANTTSMVFAVALLLVTRQLSGMVTVASDRLWDHQAARCRHGPPLAVPPPSQLSELPPSAVGAAAAPSAAQEGNCSAAEARARAALKVMCA